MTAFTVTPSIGCPVASSTTLPPTRPIPRQSWLYRAAFAISTMATTPTSLDISEVGVIGGSSRRDAPEKKPEPGPPDSGELLPADGRKPEAESRS